MQIIYGYERSLHNLMHFFKVLSVKQPLYTEQATNAIIIIDNIINGTNQNTTDCNKYYESVCFILDFCETETMRKLINKHCFFAQIAN